MMPSHDSLTLLMTLLVLVTLVKVVLTESISYRITCKNVSVY